MTETIMPPDPEEYLPAEPVSTEQDDDSDGGIRSLFGRVDTVPRSPFTWEQTLARGAQQIESPTQDWEGLCQSFCRKMPGCPGGAATAFIQWTILRPEYKVEGDNFDEAPWGSTLFSIGSNPAGHVQLKDRPFADGSVRAISTDAKRVGKPDYVNPVTLTDRWGQKRLGYGLMMNGTVLNVRNPEPRSLPYLPLRDAFVELGNALEDLRDARATARDRGDAHDEAVIQRRIDHLRAFRKKMRETFKELRHE